jgi:glycosyltransferase involved in cell wall biosynthesis
MSKVFEVFVGTYNAEKWIVDFIHSLENQTASPFLVTILDNQSSDRTLELIQELTSGKVLQNKYRVLQNTKNIGSAGSLVDATMLLSAPWIVSLHQDDYYHPDHIQILSDAISQAADNTGLIFTAMRRMDEESRETFNTPTLSQNLNKQSRVNNFIMSLQINPVNFPACAIRRQFIDRQAMNLHFSAFNDTELILRLLTLADVTYIPRETMHYRRHSLNAAETTGHAAQDLAVTYGLNALFHSPGFEKLALQILAEDRTEALFRALKQSLRTWINDDGVRSFATGMLAERLVRVFGYDCPASLQFLREYLEYRNLDVESGISSNYGSAEIFEDTSSLTANPTRPLVKLRGNSPTKSHRVHVRIWNSLPLSIRDSILALVMKIPFVRTSKRPFIRAWFL